MIKECTCKSVIKNKKCAQDKYCDTCFHNPDVFQVIKVA